MHLQLYAAIPLFAQRPDWRIFFLDQLCRLDRFRNLGIRPRPACRRGEKHDGGSIVAIFIFIWLGITAAFMAPHIVPSARIGLWPEPIFVTAMTLFWAGIALRLWAITLSAGSSAPRCWS